MTPAHRLRTYNTRMSLAIATAHTLIAFLGIIGRLDYAVHSRFALLREVMESDMWMWLHSAAALAIICSLLTGRRQVPALGASVGIWAVWSFLSMLWGLSTDVPVSLVAPILAGAVTTLTYLLTLSWATPRDNGGK